MTLIKPDLVKMVGQRLIVTACRLHQVDKREPFLRLLAARVKTTKRFDRQLKRCEKRGYDMHLIFDAMRLLAQSGKLPAEYRPHPLVLAFIDDVDAKGSKTAGKGIFQMERLAETEA